MKNQYQYKKISQAFLNAKLNRLKPVKRYARFSTLLALILLNRPPENWTENINRLKPASPSGLIFYLILLEIFYLGDDARDKYISENALKIVFVWGCSLRAFLIEILRAFSPFVSRARKRGIETYLSIVKKRQADRLYF